MQWSVKTFALGIKLLLSVLVPPGEESSGKG